MTDFVEAEVRLASGDGWPVGGVQRFPADNSAPGVVMVPGSRHERDAYTGTAGVLEGRGLASVRIDVRGRGTSLDELPFARMGPLQRRRVTLDVAAALAHAGTATGIRGDRLALVAEQDTAADAVDAAVAHDGVQAIVLLSPRDGPRLAAALARRPVPVLGLVSSEDRPGLGATADAYLAGHEDGSRLEVFRGLGFGVTMMSVRQFEHPDAEPLDDMIADWLAERLR